MAMSLKTLILFVFMASFSQAGNLALTETIDLSNAAMGMAEKNRTVSGGKYTSKGWEATSTRARIVIELVKPFAAGADGAIEFEATNFDPYGMQTLSKTLSKHLTFCGYGPSHGNQNNIKSGEFMFQLRTHPNYIWSDGRNNAKMMTLKWAPNTGGHAIGEKHWLGYPIAWDRNAVYTFRVEWTKSQYKVVLPTGKIYTFGKSPTKDGLRYIFIGRDNTTYTTYITTIGFIFTKVRLFRELSATAPSQVVNPRRVSGVTPGALFTDFSGRQIDARSGNLISTSAQGAWRPWSPKGSTFLRMPDAD